MSNLIENLIEHTQHSLIDVPEETQAELSEKLNMSMKEYIGFQELKSIRCAEGKLSLDNANVIYRYLGNTPTHFNEQPLAVKIVLTKIFQKLI